MQRRAFNQYLQRSAIALALAPWLAPVAHAGEQPRAWRANPFALGVASGRPRADSVVLWTRLLFGDEDRAAGTEALRVHLEVFADPALKRGVALSQTRRIGVLATRGTLQSDKFARLLRSLQDGQVQFVLQACDGLALAIENSLDGRPESEAALLDCASGHVRALGACGPGEGQIDTVVLGCTHYPLVASLLHDLIGHTVTLVETGEPVARQTRLRLSEQGWREADRPAQARTELLATGAVESLQAAARRWLQTDALARRVDLD